MARAKWWWLFRAAGVNGMRGGRDDLHGAINRSMPTSLVTPVLHYPDVRVATDWLCAVFGFRERLRIAGHRAQLAIGEASLIVAQGAQVYPACGWPGHSTMVRIADVDAHHRHSVYSGAHVISRPATHLYGERQYTVLDIGGHTWTFSQTTADVDPASWGGLIVEDGVSTPSIAHGSLAVVRGNAETLSNTEPFF